MQTATRAYSDAGDILMAGLFDRLQDEIDSQDQPGISPIDLLELPSALAKVIREIIRKNGMKLADIATALEQSQEETQKALDELVEKGFVRRVEVKDELWYKARFGRKADKKLDKDLWSALDGLTD
jgi:hypothetical protein